MKSSLPLWLLALAMICFGIGGVIKGLKLQIHDNEIKMLINRVEALEQKENQL